MSKLSNAYAQFETDTSAEKNGVVIDYGDFYFKICRAGGANERYTRILKEKFKPHRRALQTETMSDDAQDRLIREAYAEGVIVGWGYRKNPKDKGFVDGKFLDRDGNELAFSIENVSQVITDLPDLFKDLQEQASKVSLFRAVIDEADAKNS